MVGRHEKRRLKRMSMAETDDPADLPGLEELAALDLGAGPCAADDAGARLSTIERAPRARLRRLLGGALLDPGRRCERAEGFWTDSLSLWQRFLDPQKAAPFAETAEQARDKRFTAPQWREKPVFDFLRQSYLVIADHMLRRRRCAGRMDAQAEGTAPLRRQGLPRRGEPDQLPRDQSRGAREDRRDQGRESFEGAAATCWRTSPRAR